LRGHGSSSAPATFAWAGFVGDVRAAVDRLGSRRPVAIGHSLASTAILAVEATNAGTFAYLFCWEPIVVSPVVPDAPDRDIAEIARHRQAVFPSREAAAARYRKRPPFANWDPDAFAGYIEGAFVDRSDSSVELACAPVNEARI
jgi:pimeloyl-ACP methyl ester carboxylesterase